MIHLEPRNIYDEAILEEDYACDVVIYSYDSLVEILMKQLREHYPNDNNVDIYLMAVEHIDSNIQSMKGTQKDWPLFMNEEDYQEHQKNHVGGVVRI